MSNYTEKEKKILKQCKEGPFHTVVYELDNKEFDILAIKLMNDDDTSSLISLVSIYWNFNRNTIINYYIDKGDYALLLDFLDYCNDFSTQDNILDQKYIVDKLLIKNDKRFIKDILNSSNTYFLTDNKQKKRLEEFIN